MDTITQALLGGAIGYAVAGKTSRRKAMLWGAGIAVLPDLDVFIPHANDLASMTLHRSWTHSWLVQTAIAPILAWLLHRFDKTFDYRQWWLITWLALITHSGLDALTVYGTQLFWPFMPSPVSGGSVFIIDPVYSVPLLLGFIAILLRPAGISDKLMRYGFYFSCLYLVWGFSAQQWVAHQARQTLAAQHIAYDHLQVSATAFNTILWRVIAVDRDHYYEGFHSLFDTKARIEMQKFDRGGDLIAKVEKLPAYQRIDWFTSGLFKLEKFGQTVMASDLRMGMEPSYFFRFSLAEDNGQTVRATEPNRINIESNREAGIRWVWQRIWNPSVEFDFRPVLSH
jgi:inner membrane protein